MAPSGDVAELAEGLTVLDHTDTSIHLAYRQADDVIFLEAVRGDQVPEPYRDDPESPPYEIDARFSSDSGFIFYLQQGGHGWVEPAWEEAMNRQLADRTPLVGSNEVLFRLASEASRTMREDIAEQIGEEAAAALAPEIDSIHAYASEAHKQFLLQDAARREHLRDVDTPTLEIPTETGDVAYGTPGPGDPNYSCAAAASYAISLHADSLDGLPGFAGGYHSATARHWFNGAASCGSYYSVHSNCNHGRCATTMTQRHMSGYKAFAANVLRANSCSGEYKWDSDGGSYGHNCHDDTRIQMHNFVYESNEGGHWRWCDGNDNDHDISVDILFVELDQDGYPEYSTSTNRGYGSGTHVSAPAQCDYMLGCPASYMGASDGCDCYADGVQCPDTDCTNGGTSSTPPAQCDYTLGCPASYMGANDGCDCYADGTLCPDSDCY
ncbi:MAG: hypothetical protein H6719_18195 [Sandaracinaceae bacterium]|nr:hypothetical protein [Sandaracinaceae bacterium]